MAFVAYNFHWSRDAVLHMPHRERQRWCEEISEINERINDSSGESRSRPDPGLGSDPGSGGITLENPMDDWADDGSNDPLF